MAFTEDLNVFFDLNVFAVKGIRTDGSVVVGIFDVEPVEKGSYISTEPTFLIKQQDVSRVPLGTELTISGAAYTVRNVVREDSLTTKLVLENGT